MSDCDRATRSTAGEVAARGAHLAILDVAGEGRVLQPGAGAPVATSDAESDPLRGQIAVGGQVDLHVLIRVQARDGRAVRRQRDVDRLAGDAAARLPSSPGSCTTAFSISCACWSVRPSSA